LGRRRGYIGWEGRLGFGKEEGDGIGVLAGGGGGGGTISIWVGSVSGGWVES